MLASTLNETEPLIKNNKESLNVGKKFDFKWFFIIVGVAVIFTLVFVYHKAIGNYFDVQFYDGQDWNEIEHIDKDHISKEWTWHESCSGSETIALTIAVKQTNTDSIEEKLFEVSDPKSPKYGQHWTYEKVHDFLKPSEESLSAIYSWLESHGISRDNVESITPNSDFVRFTCNIETANTMLNTEFGRWKHSTSGQLFVRVHDNYFVPESVAQHIDFISPTLRFPIKSHTRSM